MYQQQILKEGQNFNDNQIKNEPQILKEHKISKEIQITNRLQILKDHQIKKKKKTQITNEPRI